MALAYHETVPLWKSLLTQGLREDGWIWDWTSLGTIPESRSGKPARARVIAKSGGIWAAEGLLRALPLAAHELGGELEVTTSYQDGDRLKVGDTVCEWRGDPRLILNFERPFLNLASYVSGIATQTDRISSVVRQKWKSQGGKPSECPRVTSTRKILPGYRDLAILGVRAGGGHSHRVTLSGGVLIKENHIAMAGGVAQAIRGARAQAPHGLKIEVEVTNLSELREALQAGADGVLLDNFSPSEFKKALFVIERQSQSKIVVEVSGGLTETNIADYVFRGVDVFSLGSLTHSVQAVDLSLLMTKRR